MPVEILCFQIKSKCIGQQHVESTGNIADGGGRKVLWCNGRTHSLRCGISRVHVPGPFLDIKSIARWRLISTTRTGRLHDRPCGVFSDRTVVCKDNEGSTYFRPLGFVPQVELFLATTFQDFSEPRQGIDPLYRGMTGHLGGVPCSFVLIGRLWPP